MSDIQIGSVLRLHKGELYEICDFCFKITEDTGNYMSFVKTINKTTGQEAEYPVFMIQEMLNDGMLYSPEKEKVMIQLMERRSHE